MQEGLGNISGQVATLSIEDLVVCYGPSPILRGVNLEVGQGEIVTLIGPNGAGKSTLLRALSRLIPISEGRAVFLGQDINRMSTSDTVRLGLSQVPEGRRVFYHMTVAENLLLGGYLRDRDEREDTLREIYDIFPRLEERAEQKGGTLSGGEQSMLVVGRALMNRPKLLLMDEPCLGLAPIIVKLFAASIQKLVERGMTILLVEQNAKFALTVATRGYVISNGCIVDQGTTEELLGREGSIRKAYLGA